MPDKPKRATPKPADPPRPKGRPKTGGRIAGRYAIVTTPEYRAWMVEFLGFIGEPEVSDVIRYAVASYAESKGFRSPPKR